MKVAPKTTRLYAAGLFLLALALLLFVQAAFNLDPLFRPSEPNEIVLLAGLSAFIFLVLLIFGASRLPEIGRGIGKGIRNFKEATKEGARDDR